MAALLEKNLNLFYKRYPSLKTSFQEKVKNISTHNFSLKDKKMFEGSELVDSLEEGFISLVPYKKENTKMLLVEGLGLGNLLRQTAEYFQGRFRDILTIEPSVEAFVFALSHIDFEAELSDPRYHWIVGKSGESCFTDFMGLLRIPQRAFQMDASQFISHPVISKKFQGYFEVARDEWAASRAQTRRGYGGIEDSLLGLENVLSNSDFMENNPGVIQAKDLFQKVPAIIVSAGPSLDKSLPALKELQDKAVIIAVDASLSILLDNGIVPHAVVAIERDGGPKTFFDAAQKKHPNLKTHLFAFPVLQKEALEAYRGPKWVAYRDYGYFQYFEQQVPRGMVSSSSSVAHLALRLAFCFGSSPVLLVGQDLAYESKTLRSHAKGLAYGGWDQSKTEAEVKKTISADQHGEFFMVEGNLEKEVPTNSTYFSFLKEFSWESSRLPFKIFNCTEGGAKIPNIQWASIVEVTKGWKTHPDLLKRLDRARTKSDSKKFDWTEIKSFLQSLSSKINQMSQLIESPEIPLDQKMQMSTVIRQAQVELMKDERYICFVIQNAGREYLDFENEWTTRAEDISFNAGERLAYLGRGLRLVQSVANRISQLFEKFDSPRQKITHKV
jgi:hypothetical protein